MNKFKITIDDNNFDVTVNITDHDKATVEVNGISYEVSYESKTRLQPLLLVNLLPYRLQPLIKVPLKIHLLQTTRRPALKHRFPELFPLLAQKLAVK